MSDRQEVENYLDPLRVDTAGDRSHDLEALTHGTLRHQPTLKAMADRVRDGDLEAVAVELGLKQDPHDQHKWRDARHSISISHGKFMDWLADKGGGGAILLRRRCGTTW